MKSLAVALAAGIAALYLTVAVRYGVRVLRWLPRYERRVRQSKGLCPACGYDLAGNVSGTCPECGTTIAHDAADAQRANRPSLLEETQPWWVWTVVLTMMALAVIVQRAFFR